MTRAKKFSIFLLSLTLLIAASLIILNNLYIKQDRLKNIIEDQSARYLQMDAEIGSLELDIIRGLHLTLNDVDLQAAPNHYIRASRITARLSPLHLLTGKVRLLQISLEQPDVALDLSQWQRGGQGSFKLPSASVTEGQLVLQHGDKIYDFSQINGSLNWFSINLSAQTLGGQSTIRALRTGKQWRGIFSMQNLQPQSLADDFGCLFPVSAKMFINGNRDLIQFSNIEISNHLLRLNGTANLSNLLTPARTALELNLSSGIFSYNELMAAFTNLNLTDKTRRLLFERLRDGRAQLLSLTYNGPVRQSGRELLRAVNLEAEVSGMSFGAGHDNERVTNLQGRVSLTDGSLKIAGSHGQIGGSAISNLELIFHDLHLPGNRIEVIIKDADISARDFVSAWRATMVSQKLHSKLDSISQVENGRIRGSIEVLWNKQAEIPTAIKANLQLQEASFRWGTAPCRRINATAYAANYGDQLQIRLNGLWQEVPIEELKLDINELKSLMRYEFELKSRGIPRTPNFELHENSGVFLEGSGLGPEISGSLQLSSAALKIFNSDYRKQEGPINASGTLSGRLWSGRSIKLQIKPDVGLLGDINLELLPGQGQLQIAGPLRLDGLYGGQDLALSGTANGNFSLSWGARTAINGQLGLDMVQLLFNDQPLTLDGRLLIQDNNIDSPDLKIWHGGKRIYANGSLRQFKNFNGALQIDGLVIERKQEKSGFTLPAGLTAHGDLTLTNSSILGLPVKRATASAAFDGDDLQLQNIAMSDERGFLNGSLIINLKGGSTFDVELAYQDTDLRQLSLYLTDEEPIIDGKMDVKGHLWGTRQSINGNLRFTARQGHITRYGMLSKIFGTLNLYKFVKTGNLVMMDYGFPYNEFSGTINASNNHLTFDDIYIDSNSVQFFAVGSYSLESQEIDCIIGAQPLETLDKTVSMIPLIGWVLTGPEGRLLIISMRMTGPLDDPEVEPAPFDSLSKPVIDSFSRLFSLPGELLNKSRQFKPSPSIIDQRD